MEVYVDGDNRGGVYSGANGHAQQYILSHATGEAVLNLGGDTVGPVDAVASAVTITATEAGVEYVYEIAFPAWELVGTDGIGTANTLTAGDIVGFGISFGDFDSQADADASAYHAFNSYQGMTNGWQDADQFPDFELGAP